MHDPRVPETLEGWSILHQMFRVRWEAWQALPEAERRGARRGRGRDPGRSRAASREPRPFPRCSATRAT